MSLPKIRSTVKQFVTGDRSFAGPGILVIKGRWGVGKTHFWKDFIAEQIKQGRLENDGYVYLSLFGLNSLGEIKTTLWVNRRDLHRLKKMHDPEASEVSRSWNRFRNWASRARKSGYEIPDKISQLPRMEKYGVGVAMGIVDVLAYPKVINNTLVCIDDLDRISDELSIRDLLGLATQLKEEHACKVVLILNEDSMGDRKDELRTHGEKGFDIEVEFEPTPQESFDLAVPTTNRHYDVLNESCLQLGIVNIRIISRIRDAAERLGQFLEGRSRKTVEEALRTLVFLTWAYHDSENAPHFEKIHPIDPLLISFREMDDLTEEEEGVANLIQEYGYHPPVRLHNAISFAVTKGYYDDDKITAELDKLDEQAVTEAGRQDYSRVWNMYRDSFDTNDEKFGDALLNATQENIANLKPMEFSEAISMLRSLGSGDDADRLVDGYVNHHIAEQGLSKFREWTRLVRYESMDPYLEKKINYARTPNREDTSMKGCLERAVEQDALSGEDVDNLASRSVDEYYNYLKSNQGDFLRKSIRWCLKFRELRNPSEQQKAVADKAQEALRKIGRESPLNKRRVESMYKIKVDVPDSP